MIKELVVTFAAVIAIWSAEAGVARAQAPAGACAADVEKYCKNVPAGGRRYRCLKQHENDLSEPCRKHIAQVKERIRGLYEACWDDVSRLCVDVQRGHGRVLQCLRDHESELSEPCKAVVAPPKK